MPEDDDPQKYLAGSQFHIDVTIQIDGRVCNWVIDKLPPSRCYELVTSAVAETAHQINLFNVEFVVDLTLERLRSAIVKEFCESVSVGIRRIVSEYTGEDLVVSSRTNLDSRMQIYINEDIRREICPNHDGFIEIVLWRSALSRQDIEFSLVSDDREQALQGRRLANMLTREQSEPDWLSDWDI